MSWEKVRVEEICDLVRGSSPRPKGDLRYYGGNVPRLMIQDITRDGKYVTPKIDFLTDAGAKLSRPMKKGELVITVSGKPGVPAILNVDACIHDGFVGLRNLSKKVNSEYLFHYFNSFTEQTNSKSVGAIFKNLTTDQIKDLQIPLPPLHIQKQIAKILDKADALRKKDQQLLQKYDELAQAIFIDMFGDPVKNEKGWDVKKCQELFEMKLGKMLSAKNYKGTHLKKYLRNVNVKWGEIDLADVKEMDFDEKEFKIYKVITGDILVCEGGEVGRAAVFEDEGESYGYQKSLHRLRIKDNKKISNSYFISYMKLAVAKGLIKKLTTSVTIQHFTLEKFRELEIIVPPISLQKNFEKMLMKIKVQTLMNQKEISESLFQSLLQKAFTGELIKE